jgi:hypothetical protein
VWLFRYPRLAAALGVGALLVGFVVGFWASRRIAEFRNRVARGFAILRFPSRYLREVVAWQALDWALRLLTVWSSWMRSASRGRSRTRSSSR